MSVYHCPLCPLIFQYRTEAEWHLREEHRSRTTEAADLRAELAAATRPLTWERLAELRARKSSPSVTLMLSTAPAPAMSVLDIARLRQLAEKARRCLAGETLHEAVSSVVVDRLFKAVSAAETQATDRGLALFVGDDDIAIIVLPFAPRDRAVVDRRFVTRDLHYALRRFPCYRVLILGRHARVLEGHSRNLSESAIPARAGIPRAIPPTGADRTDDVDTLLDLRAETAGPLPLVLVGERRDLERFHRQSRYGTDVVAEVPRPRFRTTRLVDLVAESLERMYYERQSRSVAELHQAEQHSRLAWGFEAAWNSVHDGTADQLWVEHDYAVQAEEVSRLRSEQGPVASSGSRRFADPVDALLVKAGRLGIETHVLDRHTLGRSEPLAVQMPSLAPPRWPNPLSLASA